MTYRPQNSRKSNFATERRRSSSVREYASAAGEGKKAPEELMIARFFARTSPTAD